MAEQSKHAGGRPKTEIDLAQVEQLASIACTWAEAAGVLGIALSTFERRMLEPEFRDTWERGQSKLKASLRRRQVEIAMSPLDRSAATMLIWLGKQLLGQHDRSWQEHTGLDGGPIKTETAFDLSQYSDEELAQLKALVAKGQKPKAEQPGHTVQ